MPATASLKGLGLCVEDVGETVRLVLFQLETVKLPTDLTDGEAVQEALVNECVGYASIYRLRECWVLDAVAARKGYGPLIYRIAMSSIEHTRVPWLKPSDNNSAGALSVWRKFCEGKDTTQQLFKPAVPVTNEEQRILRTMHRIKRPMDLSSIVRLWNDFAPRAQKDRISKLAISAGKQFFDLRYKMRSATLKAASKLLTAAMKLLASEDMSAMYQHVPANAKAQCRHSMTLGEWEKVKHKEPMEIDEGFYGQMYQCPGCKSHIMRALPPHEDDPDAGLRRVK